MTLIETARLLAYIGTRDGWVPSDHHVSTWHHDGTDAITYNDAINRVLEHRPAHRISLSCLLGSCDPAGPHEITAETPGDPVRWVASEIRWHQSLWEKYGARRPLSEQSYTLMVKAVGPRALDHYRAAVAALDGA